MPDYPYSDNMYSALEDSDAEEQPLEGTHQPGSTPAGESSHAPVHGPDHGYHVGGGDGGVFHRSQHDDEDEVLSPTDGYFGRSGSAPSSAVGTGSAYPSDPYSPSPQGQEGHVPDASASADPSPSGYAAAASSQVPHVPDVWVSDPSIGQDSTAESKAREVRQERERNAARRASQLDNTPDLTPASRAPGGGSTSAYDLSSHSSTFGPTQPRYGVGPGSSSAGRYDQRFAPSFSTGPSHPQHSGTIYSERSSLFSEAPPAYTPSPTSPTGASSHYQTFPPSNNMGRISEAESQSLLGGQQRRSPQDMGGEPEGGYTLTRSGGWRTWASSFVPPQTGKTCGKILLGLVLIFVTVGFLISCFAGVEDEKKAHSPGGGGSGSSPIGKMPGHNDDDGTRLGYPPFDGELPWAKGSCASNYIKYPTQMFNFEVSDIRSLSFLEERRKDHNYDGRSVHISGEVVIRRSGKGTPGPSIILETLSNDDQIKFDVNWDHAEQRLRLVTTASVPRTGRNSGEPCLQIRATLWVPPRAVLQSLVIDSIHLDVLLLENLSLELINLARISTVGGSVVSATDGEKDPKQLMKEGAPSTFNFNSRHIEVKTVSNPISGAWPLYDYLGLQTVSGPVRAGVQPKKALKEKPVPAVLFVQTISGTVDVHEPIAEAAASMQTGAGAGAAAENIIPPRQYAVDLQTKSGAIRASVAFGPSCQVHTTSGSIVLDLLPVLDRSQITSLSPSSSSSSFEDVTSILDTTSTSGTTVVKVLDALWGNLGEAVPTSGYGYGYGAAANSSPAIRALKSHHSTTSAPIRVTYPPAWEGSIEAETVSGSVSVTGEGVHIVWSDRRPYKTHLVARKGEEDAGGPVALHSTSGSITFAVGS